MFVDDTSIMITDNSQGELLQRCKNVLNHMSPKWFHAKWLTLNPTKTEVLTFTSVELCNALNLTYADHLMEVETINRIIRLPGRNIQLLLRKLSSACFMR